MTEKGIEVVMNALAGTPTVVTADFANEINQFIDKLATFLNACGEKPIYILCNDINLSKAYNGGREFFDALESKISNPKVSAK